MINKNKKSMNGGPILPSQSISSLPNLMSAINTGDSARSGRLKIDAKGMKKKIVKKAVKKVVKKAIKK